MQRLGETLSYFVVTQDTSLQDAESPAPAMPNVDILLENAQNALSTEDDEHTEGCRTDLEGEFVYQGRWREFWLLHALIDLKRKSGFVRHGFTLLPRK